VSSVNAVRNGLPCNELYRQLFNRSCICWAYGRIYSNEGAMTRGRHRKPRTA